MRIKHYIVTYRNPVWENCVRTILRTPTEHHREIWVINNHSSFSMPEDLAQHVQVLHNQTRPDFSQGHLSRNWNQAIVNGFRNLNQPDADLVIASQNDTQFCEGYLEPLIEAHQRFDIITSGDGDNCVSYTARGVKRVGLWDERFCGIFFQEADYFCRIVKHLGGRASVNDHGHRRLHNPIDLRLTEDQKFDLGQNHAIREATVPALHHNQAVFYAKWQGIKDWPWTADQNPSNAVQKMPNHIYYPYFERDVETLAEQNYIR